MNSKLTEGFQPGDERITNADEQDVVVNRSTADDNGYDEPVQDQESAKKVDQPESGEARPDQEKRNTSPAKP